MKLGGKMSTKKIEKGHGKFQWFFFIIFIPTVFSLFLIYVVLTILGVDVLEKGREVGGDIPILSDYLIEDEGVDEVNVEELLHEIEQKQMKIAQLETRLEKKDEEIDSLSKMVRDIEEQLQIERDVAVEVQQELKEIAKLYEAMSAKNAANILAALSIEEVVVHISQISMNHRAAILAKMDPEQAGQIISLLAN